MTQSFRSLIQAEWHLLLFGFVMLFSSSFGQTFFIALFGGEIRQDLGLSHGQFGSIYSLATLCSAILLLWSGSLLDKMDLRTFSYIVVAGLVLGCLAMAFSYHFIMLFIALLLLRHFGQALMYMTGTTAVVRYIDQQKGKANALTVMGYSVAEALLPSITVMLMVWLSWRESWIAWAVILLITMPLLIRWSLQGHNTRHQRYLDNLEQDDKAASGATPQTSSPQTKPASRKQWTRGEVIRDPLFYLFMPALMAQPLLFTGFMFHQIHLIEEKGWSLAFWGSLYLLYALVSTAAKLLSGSLVDRLGAVRLVPYITLPLGLGLCLLSLSSSHFIAVVFMICTGLSVALSSIVSAPFFAERYGNRYLGAIKSLSTSVMVFMSALSPVALGWLIDLGLGINSLALGGAAYVVLTSALAYYAYKVSLQY